MHCSSRLRMDRLLPLRRSCDIMPRLVTRGSGGGGEPSDRWRLPLTPRLQLVPAMGTWTAHPVALCFLVVVLACSVSPAPVSGSSSEDELPLEENRETTETANNLWDELNEDFRDVLAPGGGDENIMATMDRNERTPLELKLYQALKKKPLLSHISLEERRKKMMELRQAIKENAARRLEQRKKKTPPVQILLPGGNPFIAEDSPPLAGMEQKSADAGIETVSTAPAGQSDSTASPGETSPIPPASPEPPDDFPQTSAAGQTTSDETDRGAIHPQPSEPGGPTLPTDGGGDGSGGKDVPEEHSQSSVPVKYSQARPNQTNTAFPATTTVATTVVHPEMEDSGTISRLPAHPTTTAAPLTSTSPPVTIQPPEAPSPSPRSSVMYYLAKEPTYTTEPVTTVQPPAATEASHPAEEWPQSSQAAEDALKQPLQPVMQPAEHGTTGIFQSEGGLQPLPEDRPFNFHLHDQPAQIFGKDETSSSYPEGMSPNVPDVHPQHPHRTGQTLLTPLGDTIAHQGSFFSSDLQPESSYQAGQSMSEFPQAALPVPSPHPAQGYHPELDRVPTAVFYAPEDRPLPPRVPYDVEPLPPRVPYDVEPLPLLPPGLPVLPERHPGRMPIGRPDWLLEPGSGMMRSAESPTQQPTIHAGPYLGVIQGPAAPQPDTAGHWDRAAEELVRLLHPTSSKDSFVIQEDVEEEDPELERARDEAFGKWKEALKRKQKMEARPRPDSFFPASPASPYVKLGQAVPTLSQFEAMLDAARARSVTPPSPNATSLLIKREVAVPAVLSSSGHSHDPYWPGSYPGVTHGESLAWPYQNSTHDEGESPISLQFKPPRRAWWDDSSVRTSLVR